MVKFPHVGDGLKNLKTAEFEVEYEDVMNFKELYKRVYDWTTLWNYKSIDGNGELESLYMELVDGKGNRNHHIWWRFERKESNFIKYFIKFDFQTLRVSAVEFMHEGKKVKADKGDVIMRVEGWVMFDYKDEWDNHWLLKHVRSWFFKRWYKDRVDFHKKQLWFEVYDLEDMIKQHLMVNTSKKMPNSFQPRKGFME